MRRYRLARHVAPTSLGLLVLGCNAPGPPVDDVQMAVEASVPDYSVSDISCKNFEAQSQAGMGRTSCAGNLALRADLFEELDFDQIAAQLAGAGIPQEGTGFFFNRHRTRVIGKVAEAGSPTPFTAECSFREQVDDWRVECRPEFAPVRGRQIAFFDQPYVIDGSPEHGRFLKDAKADFDDWNNEYLALSRQIEAFFTKGNVIVAYKTWKTPNPVFQAPLTESFAWQGKPGFLGHAANFSFQLKYKVLQPAFMETGGRQSFCGHRKGTPPDDLLVTGVIYTRRESEAATKGRFGARLQIAGRGSGNSFSSCNNFEWNGEIWQYRWILGKLDMELKSVKP